MPTRRFEGRNLEAALARASTEVGSEARVVSAERVRSGGLGGFFARERVEIEVELEGDDSVVTGELVGHEASGLGASTAIAGQPASLLDLADRISSAERFDGGPDGTPGGADARPGGRRRSGTGVAAAIGRHSTRAGRERGGPDDRGGPAPTAAQSAAPQPTSPQPTAPRPATAHAAAQFALDPHPDDADASAVVLVGSPPPAPRAHVSTETSTFAEILDRITAETGGTAHSAVVAGAPSPPTAPVAGTDVVVIETAATAGSATVPGTAAPVPVPAPAAVQLVVRPAPPTFRSADDGGPLTRLGLPPELEPTGPDLRDALVAQLAALPQPPALPTSRGTVIAVVGPPGLAYQTARTIRGQVGTDIPITTFSRRAPGDANVDEVSDQRRAWRRRPGPTVAVVDAPIGRPVDWAADALCALEPTTVWGIVEASRKTEDIAAWSSGLGGIDALCLTGLEETVSPAAPLRTGVPVALLDGQPATPERWAELLLDRLSLATANGTGAESVCSGT